LNLRARVAELLCLEADPPPSVRVIVGWLLVWAFILTFLWLPVCLWVIYMRLRRR